MTRETLVAMLAQAPGVKTVKGRHQVAKDHRFSAYLGEPGRAMVLSEIDQMNLHDDFLEITSGDEGIITLVAYESVCGLAIKPDAPKNERRAGFA